MNPYKFWFLVATATVSGGCETYACTLNIEPGVIVAIEDSAGTPAASGATGWVRDELFVDTLKPYGYKRTEPVRLWSLAGAHERAGVYQVHVEKPGYASWDTSFVLVREAKCHVEEAHLLVTLRKL